jgi:hypothetical protein
MLNLIFIVIIFVFILRRLIFVLYYFCIIFDFFVFNFNSIIIYFNQIFQFVINRIKRIKYFTICDIFVAKKSIYKLVKFIDYV